jgi:hypothetical protein
MSALEGIALTPSANIELQSLPFEQREPLGYHVFKKRSSAQALRFGERRESDRAILTHFDVLLPVASDSFRVLRPSVSRWLWFRFEKRQHVYSPYFST